MNGVFGSGPEPGSHDPADLDPGVLGRLPNVRPGQRSPRRDASAAKPRPAHASAAGRAEPEPQRGTLEDVARAGFGLAAGAAGIGFRIAGRTLGAIRDAGQRG
jgi:hypothetical protein